MFKKSIAIILVLFSFKSFGQQFLFENIGSKKGLPANECYNVMQDSKGYIWLSTEAGLCRYNGSGFAVYTADKGLPEKACYSVTEYPKGKLWVITSKNRVLYYDAKKDFFCEAVFSKKLNERISKNKSEQLYFIKPKSKNILWLCSKWASFEANVNTGEVKEVIAIEKDTFSFEEHFSSVLPIKQNYNYDKNAVPIKLKIKLDAKTYTIDWKKNSFPSWRNLTASDSQGNHYLSWDNVLIRISNSGEITYLNISNSILSLYCDNKDDLWVGTLKGGLYFYKKGQLKHSVISLKTLTVTGVCVDNENGIWCTTLEKGLYYSRDKRIISYANVEGLDTKIEYLKNVDTNLFYYSNNGIIYKIGKGNSQTYSFPMEEGFCISDILSYKNGYIVSSKRNIYLTNNTFGNRIDLKNKRSNSSTGAKTLIKNTNGDVFANQFGALFYLSENGKFENVAPAKMFVANTIAFSGDDILIGCSDGLYSINIKNFSSKKIGFDGKYITNILLSGKDQKWICTKSDGLFMLENGKIINYTERYQLKGLRLYDICFDKLGNLWLASNKGLIKIKNKEEAFNYTVFNGLPSNEIYNVASINDELYFSCSDGLNQLDINDDLKNTTSPSVYISSLKVNQKNIELADKVTLGYTQNNLSIECDVLTYKSEVNTRINYILNHDGKNTDQIIVGNTIFLDNLSPGNYVLTVFAINADGVKSIFPQKVEFKIRPPFWLRWWFILGGICLLIVFILLLVKNTINSVRKKEEEKTRINKLISESQLAALQAQMNPHFIFNAINSIQTYILENNTKEASGYLAKFSKLIRMVLNHSKEKILTLEKELEILTTYVELEQMRFENKFEVIFDISPEIDTYQIQIPPMLIQPYVENAIWHGLMPLGNLKLAILKITIKMNEEILSVVIEDNGVGRAQSEKTKKTPSHNSLGMELTENRMRILKDVIGYKEAKAHIIDLIDAAGNASGTRVELYIQM